jgi:vitamin B12 transporter
MKKLFVVAAMIPCSSLLAQQAADSSRQLDEVVVSATKSPVKATSTGKVIVTISRADIERAGGRDLAQVLTEQGGLFINGAYSNPGKDKSLYLRGARVEHTLITIDGVPVYDGSGIGSNFDMRLIPFESVERIEILKGSQGTLYGSDAIAGVVNIITRKAGTDKVQGSALLSYGSYKTLNAAANANGRSGKLDYAAGATYFDTKGISEAATPDGAAKPYETNPYSQQSANASIGYQVSPKVHLQPYVRYSEMKGNLDAGLYTDALDYSYKTKSIQPGLRGQFGIGKGTLRTLYNYNSIDRNYVDDSTRTPNAFDVYNESSYKAREHYAEAYYALLLKNFKFTAGADYRNASMGQSTMSVRSNRTISKSELSSDSIQHNQLGAYVNGLWNSPSGFTFEAGSRLNHHSRYGSNFSWNINPSYLFNNTVKVFANISTGYRTPSLYQLNGPYGNKELNPEKSFNLEGGFQLLANDGSASFRATYFNREIRDLMVFFTGPAPTYSSYYINRDMQKDHGIELDARAQFGEHFNAKFFFSYADGEVNTKLGTRDTALFNLYRRPKESFALTLGTTWGRFNASAQLNAQGKVPEQYFDNATFTTKTVTLHSYMLLNLYAEYAVKPNIRFFADLRNVSDEKYMESYGYGTPGFNAYGGIRYSF